MSATFSQVLIYQGSKQCIDNWKSYQNLYGSRNPCTADYYPPCTNQLIPFIPKTGFIPAAFLIALIAVWVYYCMKLLIQVNDVCILPLLPCNEDPYKVVARKVCVQFPCDL